MSQAPLNPSGGTAAVVQARMADVDLARLIRLATQRRMRPGTVARDLIRTGLDMVEQAEPDDPAGASA
jgi:hypothetical protein